MAAVRIYKIIIIIIIISSSSSSSSSSIQLSGRFWREPEPSQVIGMALARCIPGKFLEVVSSAFRRSQFRRQMHPSPHQRERS
jgi:hypothetical protein